jgi:dipeptidyl aminopeptidase/acylaminoacyl peptidase
LSAFTADPESQERPGFNPLYQYYLSRGYAVLATNVRGSTGYGKTFTHLDDVEKREDSVKDLAAAVGWLKTAGADSKRIAVMGGSYGGYMTMAAITLYPELVRGGGQYGRHRQLGNFSEKYERLSPPPARSRIRTARPRP